MILRYCNIKNIEYGYLNADAYVHSLDTWIFSFCIMQYSIIVVNMQQWIWGSFTSDKINH